MRHPKYKFSSTVGTLVSALVALERARDPKRCKATKSFKDGSFFWGLSKCHTSLTREEASSQCNRSLPAVQAPKRCIQKKYRAPRHMKDLFAGSQIAGNNEPKHNINAAAVWNQLNGFCYFGPAPRNPSKTAGKGGP